MAKPTRLVSLFNFFFRPKIVGKRAYLKEANCFLGGYNAYTHFVWQYQLEQDFFSCSAN
jgi:hypothetical protein